MKIRFLLDQNLSPQIIQALWRYDPVVDVMAVGQAGAPPFGTLDPDILAFCEAERRALVTENRSTMPIHEAAHFATPPTLGRLPTAAQSNHWGDC